jgi:beta-glucanase (GH16 family)
LDFHRYAICWQPSRIIWSVDGMIVHERAGWDPTPIPHLPMRLHANLWAPRSEKLAGRVNRANLPSTAAFRNISVFDIAHDQVVHRSASPAACHVRPAHQTKPQNQPPWSDE